MKTAGKAPEGASVEDVLPSGIAAATTTLAQVVYGLLRRAIIEGRLVPTAVLHEPSIAARLGISRTPVREALLRLQTDGLVAIRPQSGTTVAPIDAARVMEALIVREALEIKIIDIVADLFDDGLGKVLRQSTADMGRANQDGVYTAFIAADDQFHRLLIDRSGLKLVGSILDGVNAHLDRLRYISISAPGRERRNAAAVSEHRAIIEALASRNARKARHAMSNHLAASRSNVEAMCRSDVLLAGTIVASTGDDTRRRVSSRSSRVDRSNRKSGT